MTGLLHLVKTMLKSADRKSFFNRKIPLYRQDPILFFNEVLSFTPDEWQLEAANSIAETDKVSIKSGQGVGKTAFEAAISLWFLSCYYQARVVATAPTKHQLNDVLWAEIAKWKNKSPLLDAILQWTKTKVYMIGQEELWFAVAVATTKPENMQGFHSDNMLIIVDEASGVDEPIMDAILGTLTGENNKLLLCGNPTKVTGTFHDSHTADRSLYHCITVDSEKSPRTNKDNIKAMERKYGRDSNVFKVRVKGEFPTVEDDVLIPISIIERSIMTDYEIPEAPEVIRIGCDVARFGDDKTIITKRVDKAITIEHKRNGMDTMWTANTLAMLFKQTLDEFPLYKGNIFICIDDGGVGGGVKDRLVELKTNYPVEYERMVIVPVLFGQVIKHRYYHDTTTYMMATLRDLLKNQNENGEDGIPEIILPNDSDLVGQLSIRKYKLTDKSKIKVESKKEMKDRGLSSPDEADATLLCIVPLKTPNRKEEIVNEQEHRGKTDKASNKG